MILTTTDLVVWCCAGSGLMKVCKTAPCMCSTVELQRHPEVFYENLTIIDKEFLRAVVLTAICSLSG